MKIITKTLHPMLYKAGLALALFLPWLITPVAFAIASFMPKANLALLYLLVVIFIATKFTLRLTLISAVSGFLAFNYFFTEPYGSLLITHREDILSVTFFLVTALVVGHLAAKLKLNTDEIQRREAMSRIELDMLEHLSKAIDVEQVMAALEHAVNAWNTRYHIVYAEYLQQNSSPFHVDDTQNAKLIALFKAKMSRDIQDQLINLERELGGYFLHNTKRILAFIQLPEWKETPLEREFFTLLQRQVNQSLERIRLVSDLAQERMAKENELLRSALLSSVSHDFRTPLTAMIGAASTLLEMGDDLTKSQTRELLATVLEEAQRLNRYTQNLLDMTRLGFGELRLERHWISVAEIVSVVKKRLTPLLQEHTLSINLAPQLPLLYVHAALIEQALFNVLDNAVKFSPQGSAVKLNGILKAHRIVISVCDSGSGIDDAEKEKVFERFHTAGQGDRRKSGSGLGLTICRGMIAAHGGKVSIHDNPDMTNTLQRGCCVRIELPVEEANEKT